MIQYLSQKKEKKEKEKVEDECLLPLKMLSKSE